MKNKLLNLSLFIVAFISPFANLEAQTFEFPNASSALGCTSGSYVLNSRLSVTGILVKQIYYDDPSSNTGTFAFEVIFSYNNLFTGTLPTSTPSFWQYQVTFNSSNTNVIPNITTNNLGNVPISSHQQNDLNLNNNNTYIGSASNLGFTENTLYTDPNIIELFGFQNAKLEVNLPCMNEVLSSEFTIPLSVKLSAFQIQGNGPNVFLNWTTQSEENMDRFEVQKSNDASNWYEVAKVSSKAVDGSSIFALNYSVEDPKPFEGNNYYRLKMINKDQSSQYSSTLLHTIEKQKVEIFPNPSNGFISIKGLTQNSQISIYNNLGQKLYESSVSDHGQSSDIDLHNFQNGNYIMKIINPDFTSQTKQFIILK